MREIFAQYKFSDNNYIPYLYFYVENADIKESDRPSTDTKNDIVAVLVWQPEPNCFLQ